MTIIFNKKKPFVEGVCLNKLTSKIRTPFYVYSQKCIADNYNKISKSLNANIFYSVKANSNQAILSFMGSLGAGADVVSYGELKRALLAGINPKKIIFEGVGKSKSDIEFAIKKNIRQINIESLEELEMINNLSLSLKYKVALGIRLNPDIKANTIDKIATGRKTDKFGITHNLLPSACKIINKNNNIILKGVSCHIGSQIFEVDIFKKVFKKINKSIEIIKSNNIEINHIDLGGGFGVSYNNKKSINLKNLSKLINKFFDKKKYEISVEPGRYLVANSGILITKILTTKKNSLVNFLITDAGMQTFLRTAMYDDFHKIIPLKKNLKEEKYSIAGPICESSDILARNIILPAQKTGDFLAICDTGAYGFVMASNYNSRNFPAEILVHKKNYSIIRKEEDINSLIKKDIVPKWI